MKQINYNQIPSHTILFFPSNYNRITSLPHNPLLPNELPLNYLPTTNRISRPHSPLLPIKLPLNYLPTNRISRPHNPLLPIELQLNYLLTKRRRCDISIIPLQLIFLITTQSKSKYYQLSICENLPASPPANHFESGMKQPNYNQIPLPHNPLLPNELPLNYLPTNRISRPLYLLLPIELPLNYFPTNRFPSRTILFFPPNYH